MPRSNLYNRPTLEDNKIFNIEQKISANDIPTCIGNILLLFYQKPFINLAEGVGFEPTLDD